MISVTVITPHNYTNKVSHCLLLETPGLSVLITFISVCITGADLLTISCSISTWTTTLFSSSKTVY